MLPNAAWTTGTTAFAVERGGRLLPPPQPAVATKATAASMAALPRKTLSCGDICTRIARIGPPDSWQIRRFALRRPSPAAGRRARRHQYFVQLAPEELQTTTHPTCSHELLVSSSVQSTP